MSETISEAALAAMIDACAPILGLRIDPAWRAGVAQHLRISLAQAQLIDGFALPDDAEPAAIFRA